MPIRAALTLPVESSKPVAGMTPNYHMKQARVYCGDGVGTFARSVVAQSLRSALGPETWTVAEITADQIVHGDLNSCHLLAIPGGADLPYCAALNGAGCARIRSFVGDGGLYVGFCAGAYFGSRSIEWNLGEPDQIVGPRELAFFPGIAKGPMTGPGTYDPFSENGARVVQLTDAHRRTYQAYLNGGCAFFASKCDPAVSVLAQYSDIEHNPPAIVSVRYGKGRALLSGVHIEYSAYDFASNHPLRDTLMLGESARKGFFAEILSSLTEQ